MYCVIVQCNACTFYSLFVCVFSVCVFLCNYLCTCVRVRVYVYVCTCTCVRVR